MVHSFGGSSPSVGIFWGVPDENAAIALVVDATPLSGAEPYGDFLTHARGHYGVWERWRQLGSAGLVRRGLPAAIAWHEYEQFPRGRIVYNRQTHEFIIYADRRLQTQPFLDQIVERFGLNEQVFRVQSDHHYR